MGARSRASCRELFKTVKIFTAIISVHNFCSHVHCHNKSLFMKNSELCNGMICSITWRLDFNHIRPILLVMANRCHLWSLHH
jgi:hypothetical protein